MIFYHAVAWNPQEDQATLSRYPKEMICTHPRDEELLHFNTPKLDRINATCVYLLRAIYANAANRNPTQQELNANLNSLMIEPSLQRAITDLEASWIKLRMCAIDRIDIQTRYDASEKMVRMEWGGWSFFFGYVYDDEMICLSLERLQHPTFGALVRDRDKPYDEGFELDPRLLRTLDELLFKSSGGVYDLPEIQEYIRQQAYRLTQ